MNLGEKKRLQISLWAFISKERDVTRETDKYSVEAGHCALWCTWAHRAAASSSHAVGMLLNARVSPFLHFHAKSVTGSVSLFLSYLSLLVSSLFFLVLNKNFFKKNWCSHFVWLACLFYCVGGKGEENFFFSTKTHIPHTYPMFE